MLDWAHIIRAVLRFVGVPSGDIDDCMQEVLVRAWKAARRGRLNSQEPVAVRVWVRVASARFGAAWAARHRRTPFLEDVSDLHEPQVDGVEGPALARDLLRVLRDATKPARWRAWLMSAEGATYGHIAGAERTSISTVSVRIALARRDFAAALRRAARRA